MKHLIILAISLSFCLPTIAQLEVSSASLKQISKDVKTLSSDKMLGRETGTQGEQMAAEYIVKRMTKIGLTPYGIGGYFQEFTFTPKAHPHAKEGSQKAITGKNVIGFINNNAKYTVVIVAHYDHLGMGSEGSLHSGDPQIHNGADDNASGIAAMLDVAEKLKKTLDLGHNNYLFIAFSGEEKGLWGSKSFVNNPTIPLKKITYMINMDMVGRLDSNKLAINGVGTSSGWKITLKDVNKNRFNLVLGEPGIGPSDHTSFYLEEIPVLHLFTGQHSDYHKPSDDFEKVNVNGIGTVSLLVYEITQYLDEVGKLDYIKTKSDKSSKAPKFKVTLGVMPDYMFQGDGMRIDGVIPERPAEKAGILKGDIVIKMGTVEIKDMQSYMTGLSKLNPRDTAEIEIIRNSKKMKLNVTF